MSTSAFQPFASMMRIETDRVGCQNCVIHDSFQPFASMMRIETCAASHPQQERGCTFQPFASMMRIETRQRIVLAFFPFLYFSAIRQYDED